MKKVVFTYLSKLTLNKVILAICIIPIFFFICLVSAGLQSRLRAEWEIIAARNLEKIHAAQEQFKSLKGRYGMMKELAEAGLLEPHLAGDQTALKFSYWISDLSSTTFCIHA